MECLIDTTRPEKPGSATPRSKSGEPSTRRRAKRMNEARLYQSALYYLGRYAASTSSVRRVLGRRVTKYAAEDGVDLEAALGWIDGIIERLTRSGVLDDAGFAAARARSLFGRGLSARMIRMKLAEKGLGRDVIDQAMGLLVEEHDDLDLIAARRFVQRRRLGSFRTAPTREGQHNRDLAAMARAGFAFDVARKVLEEA